MIQSLYPNSTTLSYGAAQPGAAAMERTRAAEGEKREAYGSALLLKLDQGGYDAFLRATQQMSYSERAEAAKGLERTAAISAANRYAIDNKIERTTDMSLVYAFFENYNDVVSTDQIKHLLNSRLAESSPKSELEQSAEPFIYDYLAQLGGSRRLDLRV